jgi:hypothetical protein
VRSWRSSQGAGGTIPARPYVVAGEPRFSEGGLEFSRIDLRAPVVYAAGMRIALAIALFGFGCTQDHGRSEPPLARVDLRAAMQGTTDVKPIGLAVASDGQRFFFDEAAGLFRLDGDRAVVVVPMSAMPNPGPTAQLELPITDLVALAPNLFAFTAIGDGFLLDTAAMTLAQHFCYVPDDLPVSLTQRTDALAFDPASQRLFAQPLTFDAAGVFQYAQVAEYRRDTGEDIAWHATANDVNATGMILLPGVGLVLGQGSRLSRFDYQSPTPVLLDDLARFGVRSIDGLAIDPATGALLVVDSVADALFEIERAAITLD